MISIKFTAPLLIGLLIWGCVKDKKQADNVSQPGTVQEVISAFETKAEKYEKPANKAVQLVIESMGDNPEELKNKDLQHLRGLAKQAQKSCLEAADAFKEFGVNLPKSLPDTIEYSMLAVSAFMYDAYLGRADAMLSAERLFSDSLEYHIKDISNKLKSAMQLSDRAAAGLRAIKKMAAEKS